MLSYLPFPECVFLLGCPYAGLPSSEKGRLKKFFCDFRHMDVVFLLYKCTKMEQHQQAWSMSRGPYISSSALRESNGSVVWILT